MKKTYLLIIAAALISCKSKVDPLPVTTEAPATTIAVTTTIAPSTTVVPDTTTTVPSADLKIRCQLSFGGQHDFKDFDTAISAAKLAGENFCINYQGKSYCAVAGGCFGPCSSCVDKTSAMNVKVKTL